LLLPMMSVWWQPVYLQYWEKSHDVGTDA
jgi:hypothetical protein